MHDIFVARQPIYHTNMEVYGYELLFRDANAGAANITDGDAATSAVIINSFAEIGIENITQEHLAFINLTRNFATGEHPIDLDRTRVILEILEDIKPDAEVIAGVKRLASLGYTIALDDFIYHPDLEPLIDIAKIIKIDLMQLSRDELKEHVEILKKKPVKLLAEKIETHEEFELCKELGFDYYQGYFFCKPKIIQGQRAPTNRITLLQLLAIIQKPDVTLPQIERIIKMDVSLTYRLLRYINSAHFGFSQTVESISQAVMMIGTNTIKSMITLLLLANIDDKPHELLMTALLRAKMCELLGEQIGKTNKDAFFTVGLFSPLDALLDMTMDEALSTLPLSENIKAALTGHDGVLGSVCCSVIAYERAEWDKISLPGLPDEKISHAYLDALSWAEATAKEIAK